MTVSSGTLSFLIPLPSKHLLLAVGCGLMALLDLSIPEEDLLVLVCQALVTIPDSIAV